MPSVLVSTQTAFWKIIQEFGELEMAKNKKPELHNAGAVILGIVRADVRTEVRMGVRRMMAELSHRLEEVDEEGRKEAGLIYLRFIKEGGNSACTEMYAEIEKNGFRSDFFGRGGH